MYGKRNGSAWDTIDPNTVPAGTTFDTREGELFAIDTTTHEVYQWLPEKYEQTYTLTLPGCIGV